MYRGKRILSIIPARGGSKGLPRKNILPLLGKPLLVWTLEQALRSNYCDKVMVSTDDVEIAEVARKNGADVPFMRPKELAADTTPMFKVVAHALSFYKSKGIFFDYVAILQPTSPLRKADDIDNAIKMLIDHEKEGDSLVSLGEAHKEHPSMVQKIVGGYVKPYEVQPKKVFRRQDLVRLFSPNGLIFISKTEKILKYETFYQRRAIPYHVERWQNFEVDDLVDFICIEAILKNKMS